MVSLNDNYDLFRQFSADKSLNLLHNVIKEAVLNTKMDPAPFDPSTLTNVGTFADNKILSTAGLSEDGKRLNNLATYSSSVGISESFLAKA